MMYLEILRPYPFMKLSCVYLGKVMALSMLILTVALYLSLWVAPSDFQQGENSRILYIHVPAAWMSLLIYIAITVTSCFYLFTRHPVFSLCSLVGAKIGSLFTLLTLITGSLWGKPMWGTFWVWDARLTSVLILFFIYLGALRFQQISADIASIFLCLGLINIPIIKFSVNWWTTLHQASSISQFGSSVHVSMLIPILWVFFSFVCLSILLTMVEMRQSILHAYSSSLSIYISNRLEA